MLTNKMRKILQLYSPVYLPITVMITVESILLWCAITRVPLFNGIPAIFPLIIVIGIFFFCNIRLYQYLVSRVKLYDVQLWKTIQKSLYLWDAYRIISIFEQLPDDAHWVRILKRAYLWLIITEIQLLLFVPLLLCCWSVAYS